MATVQEQFDAVMAADKRDGSYPGPLAAADLTNPAHVRAVEFAFERVQSETLVVCTRCSRQHSPLTTFPGGICLPCKRDEPTAMPTADDVVRAWGGRA